MRLHRINSAAFCVACVANAASLNHWVGPDDGAWSNPAYWDEGVLPVGPAHWVSIENGANVILDYDAGFVQSVSLGWRGTGHLTMQGTAAELDTTSFDIGDAANQTSSLTLSGGTLNISGSLYVAGSTSTDCTVDHNSGTLNAVGLNVGSKGKGTYNFWSGLIETSHSTVIGGSADAEGILNMHGGTLSPGTSFKIGAYGMGTLNQNGGSITSNSATRVGLTSNGIYNLYNGTFSSANLHIASNTGSTGEMNQYGGTATINGTVYCSFQSSTAGSYTLDGASAVLNSKGTMVGRYSNGQFYHNNGTHNLNGDLTIANSASLATYELNGGSLTVTGDTYVGQSFGLGQFLQTGGTANFQAISIAYSSGSSGEYIMSGGSATITDLQVGSSHAGKLAITDASASLTVTNSFTIGHNGTFEAVPGTIIYLTGTNFSNQSTDPASFAGLAHTTFDFRPATVGTDTFEACFADRGSDPSTWADNAIHTIILGGSNPANIQLTDWHDNQADGSKNDVLYVRNLILAPGATLDLNGIDVYYNTLSLDPTASILNDAGALFQQVPTELDLSALDLNVTVLEAGNTVTFHPIPGYDHTVQYSDTLQDLSWADVPGGPHNSGAVNHLEAGVPKRFYRVKLVAP